MENKPHILSYTLFELMADMKALALPAFRAKQVFSWVYDKGVVDISLMTNLGEKEKNILAKKFDFSLPDVTTEQVGVDGTTKWLFKMPDGHEIETVFIPEANRGTLCVSSQVGCTLSCRFCHTGTQGLSRNLTSHEIVAQVWLAKKQLGEWEKEKNSRRVVGNIVFMGMGEPLYNWLNVKQANHVLMDEKGMAFGGRRITISTSGMVENIAEVGELGVNLAISIHAPDDETRTKIMPINNKWNIADLMKVIHNFPLREHRRITWEYVMLKGVNDSQAHAKKLVELIDGIPSFVNIIPFNAWPGSPFDCSDSATIDKFDNVLHRAGVSAAVRRARGEDILAACGQLRGETSKNNTVSLQYPSVIAQYGNDRQKAKVKIVSET